MQIAVSVSLGLTGFGDFERLVARIVIPGRGDVHTSWPTKNVHEINLGIGLGDWAEGAFRELLGELIHKVHFRVYFFQTIGLEDLSGLPIRQVSKSEDQVYRMVILELLSAFEGRVVQADN